MDEHDDASSPTAATAGPVTRAGRRNQGAATNSPRTTSETSAKIEALVRDCERLSHYHSIRQRFFENVHNWISFLILVSGSASVAGMFGMYPDVAVYVAILPPFLGGLDLVFQIPRRANDHALLYRRLCQLLGDIHSAKWDAISLSRFHETIHGIYADEPPVMWALSVYCHNAVCDSIGAPEDQYIKLRWYEKLLMQVFSFNGQGRQLRRASM